MEMILKILFMGSPEISIPFLDLIHEKNCEMIVFSQKDKVRKRGKKLVPTPVKSRALELNIPVHTVSAKSQQAFDIINDFSPDIIFVVAYGQILPDRILKSAKLYPLNVHFSLLPDYRGATPVNTALLNGDKTTGTTLMVMDIELDTGDIVFQKKCNIAEDDNATSLFEKLIDISVQMIDDNWDDLCSGQITRTPQPDGATYTKLIKKSDLILDLNSDAEMIVNRIKAFTIDPGVKTNFRGNPLFIEKAELIADTSGEPGTVFEVGKDFFNVYCGKGALKISQVKPAGKRSMKAKEFINGYKPQIKEVLG
jgi:methionyl-tRNA formyltransferase